MGKDILFLEALIPSDIKNAKGGNRESAEKLLELACLYMNKRKPFPPVLRDYYLHAFTLVLKRKKKIDEALYLRREKKSKRPDMANISQEIAIAMAVHDGVEQGLKITKAIDYVLDNYNFGIGFEQIKRTYRKWRTGIIEDKRLKFNNLKR